MSWKHAAKGAIRTAYASGVRWSGISRVIDRVAETRMLVLYGHCVAADEYNADLDADMKIGGERLRAILTHMGRRFDLVTVGEGLARLDRIGAGDKDASRRSMVALSMDDGYRDNLHVLVPLLRECGARATVFLEAGAVVDRTLPWLHALGWLDRRFGAAGCATRLAERIPASAEALRATAGDSNALKRVLKYDVERVARAEALDALVRAEGVDPSEIVDALYLSHEEAKQLAGEDVIEIGGHTISHPVLSRLGFDTQVDEIGGGSEKLRGLLGDDVARVFAYPYGRRWDFDDGAARAAESTGHRGAVTTHAGTITAASKRFRLARWPIHDGVSLTDLECEASGAYSLARRAGLDLVE